MEFVETDIPVEKIEVETSDSADDFQKFIYELFDKNGILNDLRAYLRSHIVNVLKSVHTGDPLLCQRHFAQRLDLASQALNVLIAEYLLRLEFTYSLSVFVSEIPLSNMVFDFAKTLMKGTETSQMRMKDNDVWSVLNYLGVQCDSEHALKIVDMYKSEDNMPLLHCIIKCMPMYRQEAVGMQEEDTSPDSLTSSTSSIKERQAKIHKNISCNDKCRHYAFCKTCQHRIVKIKEKYKKKKEEFVKMFEQLKSVYETEVDMVRREEECRVKRTIASHALQLQQRRQELEETLKTKEAELESNAQQKKQFLWGVARTLRSQHEHVSRAMALVKEEQVLLAKKESDLKAMTLEAEESLRKKGEEMRIQISKELAILAEQLESMKRERDSLNKARDDFENLKSLCDSKTKIIEAHGEKEKQDLKTHYEKLKDEFTVLKKFIEATKMKTKNYVDQGTITDLLDAPSNSSVLNNTQYTERNLIIDINGGGFRPPNKVLNDLKKPKNVNFSQSNLDLMYGEISRERSQSSVSSEECDQRTNNDTQVIQRLIEENESLKDYARQQREHISALWSERVRSSPPSVSRPCTAPAVLPAAHYFTVHGVNPSTSVNTFGWRKGAGEELSLFPEQRILLPGEPLPLLGLVRDRHVDNRRHLINQWRALKRSSPLAGVSKPRKPMPIHLDMGHQDPAVASGSSLKRTSAEHVAQEPKVNEHLGNSRLEPQEEHPGVSPFAKVKSREKSPKTVLKEAKEKLRNKSNIKEKPPIEKRDKSPNAMLREAKLRLRKLEIEAEAVEKSYMDFRKRQAELRGERDSLSKQEEFITGNIVQGAGINQTKTEDTQPIITNTTDVEKNYLIKNDFDKYLRDYQTKFDIGEMHFKNKSVVQKIKPIPPAYSEVNAKRDEYNRNNIDYLSTPLMEFRKFYHAEKERTGLQLRHKEQLKVLRKPDDRSMKINDDATVLLKNEQVDKDNVKSNNKESDTDIKKDDSIVFELVHEPNVEKIVDKSETDRILKFITDDAADIQNENTLSSKLPEQEENNVVDVIEVKEYKRLETLRKIRNNKAAELEVLKENITKMYNLQPSPRSLEKTEEENLEDLIRSANIEQNIHTEKRIENDDANLLRVEVESSCEMNKVKLSESQDELLIVVQSSANTQEGSEEAIEKPGMSVIVSPKERHLGLKTYDIDRNESPSIKSDSPEKAATLTRNDVLNAIFHADDNHDISSVDMNLELANIKDDNISDVEKEAYDDYPDDFSADVDNYNSRSDYGNNSPISLPKTSEDENFWDN